MTVSLFHKHMFSLFIFDLYMSYIFVFVCFPWGKVIFKMTIHTHLLFVPLLSSSPTRKKDSRACMVFAMKVRYELHDKADSTQHSELCVKDAKPDDRDWQEVPHDAAHTPSAPVTGCTSKQVHTSSYLQRKYRRNRPHRPVENADIWLHTAVGYKIHCRMIHATILTSQRNIVPVRS